MCSTSSAKLLFLKFTLGRGIGMSGCMVSVLYGICLGACLEGGCSGSRRGIGADALTSLRFTVRWASTGYSSSMKRALTGVYLELVVLDALLDPYDALMLGTTTPLEERETRELVDPLLDRVTTLEPSGHIPLCLSSGSLAGAGRDMLHGPKVPVSHLYRSVRVLHIVSASTPSL